MQSLARHIERKKLPSQIDTYGLDCDRFEEISETCHIGNASEECLKRKRWKRAERPEP